MRLLTKKEACERLSVSLTTLNGLLYSGDLPHVRFGRNVRFTEADLEEFVAARRIDVR